MSRPPVVGCCVLREEKKTAGLSPMAAAETERCYIKKGSIDDVFVVKYAMKYHLQCVIIV